MSSSSTTRSTDSPRAVLPHVEAGQDHQDVALRNRREALQPRRTGHRRQGYVLRPYGRHGGAVTKECLVEAARHKGMSVVEALQNCVIFNDKTHAAYAGDKATRAEHTVVLRHGEKMLFGANREKGLVFENMKLKVVTVGQDGYTLDDVLTHDAHERDTTLHTMLAAMKYPDYPVALGVIRAVEDDAVYDRAVERQVEEVKASSKIHCVDDLLRSGATWEVE